MDFEKLLRVAKKNELTKKEPVKCLQTKFKPPTKEQHDKDRVLSEGVQKFLARKEQEEKKKQMEAERRKQELLALRAKDPKANKRIQTMLKRTKSANKSVMEDAVDNNNTADTLAGPSQPDEDDYGFVSESSSLLYNKLIQKMYSTPSDGPKFAPSKKPNTGNLLNTKERVKQALLKQEEEERLPHKRKRKGKEKKDEEDENLNYSAPDRDLSTSQLDQNKVAEKPKAKKPMPPPVDFHQLLKIAEQKQHEPIVFEPKKVQEPEQLMTKKQKLEYERMQEWKRQREQRLKALEKGEKWNLPEEKKPLPKIPKTNSEPQKKINDTESKSKIPEKAISPIKKARPEQKASESKHVDEETSRLIRERNEALRMLKEKEKLIKEREEAMKKLKEKEQLIKERDEAMRKLKILEEIEKKVEAKESQKLKTVVVDCQKPAANLNSKPEVKKIIPKGSGTVNGTERKLFPPKDMKILAKGSGNPQNMQRGKQFPPADVRRKVLAMKKRRIESDDEYDSELEDFIDDDDHDVPQEDVSKVISEIFKYDKNKYSRYDENDDDECMESNFARISKEEFFSTKCGIMEDLKDIQREKAMMAKRKKKR